MVKERERCERETERGRERKTEAGRTVNLANRLSAMFARCTGLTARLACHSLINAGHIREPCGGPKSNRGPPPSGSQPAAAGVWAQRSPTATTTSRPPLAKLSVCGRRKHRRVHGPAGWLDGGSSWSKAGCWEISRPVPTLPLCATGHF